METETSLESTTDSFSPPSLSLLSCSSASLPSSKEFTDRITLHYLSEGDKVHLAQHLDIESAWRHIAEEVGMMPVEIRWVTNRKSSIGSETLIFFNDLISSGVSLNKFIKAVNECNYRVEPAVEYLNKRLPEIQKRYLEDMKKHSNNVYMKQKDPVSDHLSKLGSLSNSNFCRLESKIVTSYRGRRQILLTYTSKDLKSVLNVTRCLVKNDFGMSVDRQESLVGSPLTVNRECLAKIKKIFNDVSYVLVLVSPNFQKAVETSRNLPADSDNPDAGCRYIINLMEADVDEKKSISRFVAVFINGASIEDVPSWMQPCRKYNWPNDYKGLFFYIMDPEAIIRMKQMSQSSNGEKVHSCPERTHSCGSNGLMVPNNSSFRQSCCPSSFCSTAATNGSSCHKYCRHPLPSCSLHNNPIRWSDDGKFRGHNNNSLN